MKVKAKKVEEAPVKETLAISTETAKEDSVQKTTATTKEKKSSVAIIWSPKDQKKEEQEVKTPSSFDAPKFVSRDAFSHTPKEHEFPFPLPPRLLL